MSILKRTASSQPMPAQPPQRPETGMTELTLAQLHLVAGGGITMAEEYVPEPMGITMAE